MVVACSSRGAILSINFRREKRCELEEVPQDSRTVAEHGVSDMNTPLRRPPVAVKMQADDTSGFRRAGL